MIGFKQGSSIMEYAVLIALFCAVVLGIQVYIKRAVQGNLSTSAKSLGEQFSAEWSNYTYEQTIKSERKETVESDGSARSELQEPELMHNSGYVDNFSDKRLVDEKLFED